MMKYYLIILVLLGSTSLVLVHHGDVYGVNVPKQPQELMDVSDVILVGNIAAVNVTEIVETIGTKHPQNYITSTDEYVVKVEKFLKNPLDLETLTVKSQGTRIGGFEKGDRVLFYIKSINGTNTYFPESFVIPQYCDARNVLEEPRIEGGNHYTIMQGGVEKRDNFTANKPIASVYEKDMYTLSGKNLDILVHIAKKSNDGKNPETAVFSEEIHTASERCKWIASAKWEFTLEQGEYRRFVSVKENGNVYITYRDSFSVISDTINNQASPLKQFNSGISFDEIQCKQNLVLIQKYDGSPACVTESTKTKLIERGWTGSQTTDLIDISTMFCGKSFEQIQSETTFHILNPQILPEGYSLKSTDDASLGTILLSYAKGNTCGTNPDTLNDGKIELVIRYDPDRTDESDGIAFLDSYKEKYEQNNIEYKTNITDEGLYIIGTGMGIGKSITVDENGNTIHEEQFDDPARVYVLDSNTNVGYKITAYFPLDQMMNIAKSLS